MEAHDVPDRLIPPTWSPAQVICTTFASAAAAAGLLGTVTTGRLISLGLVVFSLLTFVVVSARIPPRRILGPYLVLSGTTLLQLSLLCRSDVSASLSHDGLLSPDCAYGVAEPPRLSSGAHTAASPSLGITRRFSAPARSAVSRMG